MKFSRYLIWNFVKMFLIVTIGAIFMFAVIDFVGNIKTWLARETKDAIDYRVYPEYRTKYEMRRDAAVELVRCPYFTTELFELTREMEIPGRAGNDKPAAGDKDFLILIGIAGQARLRTERDETVLSAGEAILVPASDGALSALPLAGDGGDGSVRFLTTHL